MAIFKQGVENVDKNNEKLELSHFTGRKGAGTVSREDSQKCLKMVSPEHDGTGLKPQPWEV